MAFSDNPAMVTVPGGTFAGPTLTATTVGTPTADTTVTITVLDTADGTEVTVRLILDVAPTLTMQVMPSSITLTGFANPEVPGNPLDDVVFLITGGTEPFSMSSDNHAIIASQGGLGAGMSTFTIDPDDVGASTTVTLTVMDSLGETVTVTVTVTPSLPELALNPSDISVMAGDVITFHIMGGVGPYETFTDNSASCPVPGSPTVSPFTVTTGTPSPTAPCTITVQDSLGTTATATITVN